MPFTVTYKELRSPVFTSALRKVTSFTGFGDVKVAYNAARAVDLLEQHLNKMNGEMLTLVNEWAEKDEGGKLKLQEGIPGSFVIPEAKLQDWEKAVEEFGAKEVTVERHKFPLETLSGVGLSPSELLAIESLLEEP